MDSDSDSPFNYSWPSFPKMRMRRKTGKKGNTDWTDRLKSTRSLLMSQIVKYRVIDKCLVC